jgi:hypothetical protein
MTSTRKMRQASRVWPVHKALANLCSVGGFVDKCERVFERRVAGFSFGLWIVESKSTNGPKFRGCTQRQSSSRYWQTGGGFQAIGIEATQARLRADWARNKGEQGRGWQHVYRECGRTLAGGGRACHEREQRGEFSARAALKLSPSALISSFSVRKTLIPILLWHANLFTLHSHLIVILPPCLRIPRTLRFPPSSS